MSETSKKKTLAERASTEPTELHVRMAAWLEKETGVKVDLKTVQLAVALRMDFQRSENNQEVLAAKKEAAAKAEADKLAKRKAKLEAELAKLSSAVEVTPKAEEAPEEPAQEPEVTPAEPVAAEPQEAPQEAEEPAPAKPVRRSRRTRTVGPEPIK